MTMSMAKRNLFVSMFAVFAVLFGFGSHALVQPVEADASGFIAGTDIKDDELKNTASSNLTTKLFGAAKIFAGFVLAVSVIVIVYGGLKYVLAQGDQRAAETAKMLIIYAGIGIFIALSAFIVVKMFQGFASTT